MTEPSKVADLRPAEYNPRTISPAQLEALAASLKEFGDLSGVIFNRQTGNLIGGHQRLKQIDPEWAIDAQEYKDSTGTVRRGYIQAPDGRSFVYREVDWPLQKEKAANVAANKHGGDWDIPKLKELLVSLDDGSFDFKLTGFDEKELQLLIDRGGNVPMPDLDGPSEKLFEQMTFILSREQAALVKAAVQKAIEAGPFEGTGNENKNGNGLARIAAAYSQ